ncbi:MAG: glutathione S-transferase family protein [Halioglobus sp.]
MPNRSNTEERILYGFWLSPYMSLVAHVLIEAGLPFQYKRVSPYTGDTQRGDQLTRNSLGKIPSLREPGGIVLSESQAICRYLARSYDGAEKLYPCHDPVLCSEVDRINDFLTFSISGPFFNWFVVGAYWPQAWGASTELESDIFSTWSMISIKGSIARILNACSLSPYLLGNEPSLPDFHLFNILELGKTFSDFFNMPALNLTSGDARLEAFYQAMIARPSSKLILAEQEKEREMTRTEIFEHFGPAYKEMLIPAKAGLSALFGHEV